MNYLSTLIDLIIPAQCLRCHSSGNYLCATCRRALPSATPINQSLTAVYDYHDQIVKRAVKLLKYRQGRALARDLGAALYEKWQELEKLKSEPDQSWLVLPAPSSRAKSRGYSQTELLARALVSYNPARLKLREKILHKARETPSQVSLKTRAERLANLQNAFSVSSRALVANQNMLIIDDVITTGATMRECERVLLASGAREVRGLAVAHGNL